MIPAETTAPATAPENTGAELATQSASALANVGDTVRASWRFSLDTLRSNTAYMSPAAKEALVWAFTWCIDPAHPLRFEEFAGRVDYSSNTLWKMFSGKYRHPDTGAMMDAPEKLLKNIRDFRRLELMRAKLGRKKYITTPTSKRIYWAIEQARKSGRPVMIYGGSQLGKTAAFKQNCIDFNHGKTVLVEIEAVNGLKGLLQAIAVKLGISPKANTPDLIERIKRALTPDMVLILDEVHLLANVYRKGSFFACMEQLRRLWDAVGFGLVLSYTDLGYAKAEEERKRELMQVFRRGVLKVNLGATPKAADVRCFIEAAGLAWDERHEEIAVAKGVSDTPFAAIKQLAHEHGVTAILERMRMAHELAADDDRTEITWRDFMVAHFAIAQQAETPASDWDRAAA
jgi:DNA transposition AAA+ family ATPase